MGHPYTGVKCPVVSSRFPVEVSRFPVTDEPPKKYPVSQGHMAEHLGQNTPCTTPAQEVFLDTLYDSVSGLVYTLCHKYVDTCHHDEVGDLSQKCFLRIITKLHTYKQHKAGFTTWCWWVCSSVLNSQYKRGRRYDNRYIEQPDGLENFEDDVDSRTEAMGTDFQEAVSDLMGQYPQHVPVLRAMFGDDGQDILEGINYRKIAEQSGMSAAKVSRVCREVVRPFFEERFNGERK